MPGVAGVGDLPGGGVQGGEQAGHTVPGVVVSLAFGNARTHRQDRLGALQRLAIELFSPTQPGRLAGSCYLFLKDAKAAVTTLERTARELQDQSKTQAVVLGNLAVAHIRQGSRDAAIVRLHEAIDVTERNRGGGGLNIIFGAGRELRRWRGSAEVQDVYDRIMALMAA